ncbi:uncharacterized protein EI90DRAFT_3027762 [Cantharellus anzutake]|uniref:uncharacterized protein n=1 Tax=Cantharellus anzutake TaxID=1750568 RepID=UPI001907550F|nr:uncharacterized protein EI90DRAFT_3027762 [Cantharellus anzutake]KAF8343982.1 hypothetical protein EI90DRAFT_3027762 [Cantharellus anzutake]
MAFLISSRVLGPRLRRYDTLNTPFCFVRYPCNLDEPGADTSRFWREVSKMQGVGAAHCACA